ncbi:BRO family protein [Kaistella polysaccharea]|uniref:BRO family protein n=1 Tax=Kaistella polysaccharea TaxID=2878534 RepID=UPI001CF4BB80|nr:BRO family protein [Kaistella polysaccharea]
MENTNIQLFEQKQVRSVWNEVEEKWYFSVQDVVGILTESSDVKQYIKRLLSRDESLKMNWGTICTLVEMQAADGKKRKIQASDTKGLLRIIQSILSKKAEPFKLWLAQVGSDRLDEMQDPELSINKAMQDYLNLGYSENWINQRLKSIEVRKELTDEWKRLGLKEGQQFATLTDIITKGWSDKNTKDYKKFKGLKKENLRDNMTNTELILNMLAEASTKDISQAVNPETFDENKTVAQQGGNVAKVARLELESKTGKKVVSDLSAKKMLENKPKK